MKKNIFISLLLLFAVAISGCGSNSKADGTSSDNDSQNSTINYQLVAVPDVIDIENAGEIKNINLYLNDTAALEPVEGKVIKAQVFDQTNGTLNTYEVTTDANGHAPFVYTAPNDLPASALTITFEVKDGVPALTKDVTVYFETSAGDTVDTTDMKLWVVPDDFNITEVNQTRVIDLYLEDNSTHFPLEDVEIIAEFFDPNYGVLDTYSGTTDSNGHVIFNYTAPETLPTSDLNITFKVLHGQPDLSVSTNVNFIGGQTIDTTNMNLYVTLDSISASSLIPELTEDIDIYVENSTTDTPLEGIEVRAVFFDPDYGHLDKYTDETDENGHIVFKYTGPEANPGNDINITFEIVNGSPIEDVNVTLDF